MMHYSLLNKINLTMPIEVSIQLYFHRLDYNMYSIKVDTLLYDAELDVA